MNTPSETGTWVIDVDGSNFERDVIQRSLELPVVIDFQAEWCGPCKELGPKLEQRARDGAGRFVLARIDVDKSPELAGALRVQSIPAVMALVGGKLVDTFQGVVPDAELDAFLDRIAPPAGGVVENVQVETAKSLADAGDVDGATELLRTHLATETDDVPARIALASILLDDGDVEAAQTVMQELDEAARATEDGQALVARLALAENAGDLQELRAAAEAAPEDPSTRLALGRGLVAVQRYEAGLEELLTSLQLDATFDDGAAKKAMLEVFNVLGLEDPVANDYRFKLSLELFS